MEVDNKIIFAAVQVVNMFDQTGTGKVVESSREALLRIAIQELRKELNKDKQRTWLTEDQAK